MLAVMVLDVSTGLKAQCFQVHEDLKHWSSELDSAKYEIFYKLDPDFVTLQQGKRSELFQIVRIQTKIGLLTWIGLYTALPASLNAARDRKGNYCGAGLWLCDSVIPGKTAASLLRRLLSAFCEIMENANASNWNIYKISLSQLSLTYQELSTIEERPDKFSRRLGDDSICIDLTEEIHKKNGIENFLDEYHTNSNLDFFRKFLFSSDESVISSVEKNKRVNIRRFAQIDEPFARDEGRSLTHNPALAPPPARKFGGARNPRFAMEGYDEMEIKDLRGRIYDVEQLVSSLGIKYNKTIKDLKSYIRIIFYFNVSFVFLCTLGYFQLSHQSAQPNIEAGHGTPEKTSSGKDGEGRAGETAPTTSPTETKPSQMVMRTTTECPAPGSSSCETLAQPLSETADANQVDQAATSIFTQAQTMAQKSSVKSNKRIKESFDNISKLADSIRREVGKMNEGPHLPAVSPPAPAHNEKQ